MELHCTQHAVLIALQRSIRRIRHTMEQQTDVDQMQKMLETGSQVSSSKRSQRSSRSSFSAAATRARAEAEAARVEVSYAEKEAAMMREKAHIEAEHQRSLAEAAQRKAEVEASLYVLQRQKTATVASAEAAIYEAAAEMEDEPNEYLSQIPPEDSARHTSEYVQTHSLVTHSQQRALVSQQLPVPSIQTESVQHNSVPAKVDDAFSGLYVNDKAPDDTQRADFSHYLPPPMSHTSTPRDYAHGTRQITDLTKHLVRRELVSAGLLQFDDRPENYWAWKMSFQDVTKDLSLTAREELDLLTKWLRPESSAQALRIRSVHVHNPTAGINMIWHQETKL